eukprot:647568-Amphidinium_carterae.1
MMILQVELESGLGVVSPTAIGLTDAFHALDRQSAGHLNLEQFKDGLKEFGYNWQDAESVFRALDANRLGQPLMAYLSMLCSTIL